MASIKRNVESPCKSICYINNSTGLCTGCYRTIGEITQWNKMNDKDRKAVIKKANDRYSLEKIGELLKHD